MACAVSASASAWADDVFTAKHDFMDFAQVPEIETLAFDPATLPPVASAPAVEDIEAYHIVPASAGPMTLAEELRYQIEKIDVSGPVDYSVGRFGSQAFDIKWDVGLAYGATTLFGLNAWGWGSSQFRFKSEGWFGNDTKYAGVDKFGHAYTAYVMSDFFTQRIAHASDDAGGAYITGALLGMGVQTYVEVLDGFSGGHGFSFEDLIADGVGAGFSALRNAVPSVGAKLDFRIEYVPSGDRGFSPVTDYDGQKYVLALKLAGFEAFEETPLRFLELQAGYYARGYSDEARARGDDRRREPYFGVALNLNELLNQTPLRDSLAGAAAARTFEYVQFPYTYIANK